MSNCCAPKTPFMPEQVLKAVDQIEKLCAKRAKNSGDTPSLQPRTDFGITIEMSTDGNVLVIGAPRYHANDGDGVEQRNSGAVFVFRRKESFAACENAKKRDHKYKLQQILVATDPKTGANQVQADALFGFALSVSSTGSRIVIAAPAQTIDATGFVYVFDQKTESLLYGAVQRIEEDNQSDPGSQFGFETALSNDGRVLFVSQNVIGPSEQTRVFIYEDCGFDFSTDCFRQSKKNKGFRLKQIVTVEQIAQETNIPVGNIRGLGSSLRLSENGNTALVAADLSTGVNETGDDVIGAGFVFVLQRFVDRNCRTGVTKWSTTQVLASKMPNLNAFFGRSITITPDARFIAVEEPNQTKISRENVGLISVFERRCNTRPYALKAELCPAEDNILDGSFIPQNSLVISDDGCTIAAGYEISTISEQRDAGAVVTYQRRCGSSEWKQTQVLTAFPSVEEGQTFGSGLAMSGDGNSLAVGAWVGNLNDFVYTFSSRFISKKYI